MLPASCRSYPMVACREYGRCRSGLSNWTVPLFFWTAPGGNREASSAAFTVGPFTRNGSVGRRPADGPGSTLLAGKFTWNESENTPFDAIAVKNENGVFW